MRALHTLLCPSSTLSRPNFDLDQFLLPGGAHRPLASAYGLAKHRDGRWEWAIAPGVSPFPRYQHAVVLLNARLHVSGGALGGGRMVEDSSSVVVLDTAAGVWCDTKVSPLSFELKATLKLARFLSRRELAKDVVELLTAAADGAKSLIDAND
ncbi:hypothetical protein HYC85_026932 [Camellia sinensis]|uniref:Uncharacterized protein n=1 Tax=Camellia sinensis TaxID=4442 RepID=A0A7J7G4Y0_CAMSI|nr:hypothetical protein HYC85_026932 [Camellia sinensis]